MTERFTKFIPFILEWETEYNRDGSVRTEHDPDDPGGTTRYGIDQRSHPGVNIEELTKDQAVAIYFVEWAHDGCEDMPPKLGEAYFNVAVNAGLGRAQKCLAVSDGDVCKFIDELERFYRSLAENHPVMRKYLKGWLNRTHALRKFLDVGCVTY